MIVEYAPEGAAAHLALVGKGITFDTGGLSIKPAASMVGMKYDMTGAATALAATLAVAALALPTRVTAFLCVAENMAGSSAMRPNDVITIKGGTTVEVLNTDAEGRLVLADGIVAASELRPDAIVDIATLTGAARNAFGFRTVPVMGDPEFTDRVVAAAAIRRGGLLAGPARGRVAPAAEVRRRRSREREDGRGGRRDVHRRGVPPGLRGQGLRGGGRAAHPVDAPRHRRPDNEGGAWGYTGSGPTGVAVRTLVALAASMG